MQLCNCFCKKRPQSSGNCRQLGTREVEWPLVSAKYPSDLQLEGSKRGPACVLVAGQKAPHVHTPLRRFNSLGCRVAVTGSKNSGLHLHRL